MMIYSIFLAVVQIAVTGTATSIDCYSCITPALADSPFISNLPPSAHPLSTGLSCCTASVGKTVPCKDFCFHGIFEAWQPNGTLTRGYWRDCHSRVTSDASTAVEELFTNATSSVVSWGDGPLPDDLKPICATDQIVRTVNAEPCTSSECGATVVSQVVCAASSSNQPATTRTDCTTTTVTTTEVTTTTTEASETTTTTAYLESTTKHNQGNNAHLAIILINFVSVLVLCL